MAIWHVTTPWDRLRYDSTANIYTYTLIVNNTVYIILIRHCKHFLVVVYQFLSCNIMSRLHSNSSWICSLLHTTLPCGALRLLIGALCSRHWPASRRLLMVFRLKLKQPSLGYGKASLTLACLKPCRIISYHDSIYYHNLTCSYFTPYLSQYYMLHLAILLAQAKTASLGTVWP